MNKGFIYILLIVIINPVLANKNFNKVYTKYDKYCSSIEVLGNNPIKRGGRISYINKNNIKVYSCIFHRKPNQCPPNAKIEYVKAQQQHIMDICIINLFGVTKNKNIIYYHKI